LLGNGADVLHLVIWGGLYSHSVIQMKLYLLDTQNLLKHCPCLVPESGHPIRLYLVKIVQTLTN
jgi:hypothetical protein